MIYPNTQNRNLEEIERSFILPNGKSIPITNLVTISISKGIAEIERENLHDVCCNRKARQ
jgi:Cu/Ag efflux pump CusA